MMPEENTYCYKTEFGVAFGHFNIFTRIKGGSVYMTIGDCTVKLFDSWVREMKIDRNKLRIIPKNKQ